MHRKAAWKEIYFKKHQGVPGGLVVRSLGFHYCGLGSIPGQGTEICKEWWGAGMGRGNEIAPDTDKVQGIAFIMKTDLFSSTSKPVPVTLRKKTNQNI